MFGMAMASPGKESRGYAPRGNGIDKKSVATAKQ